MFLSVREEHKLQDRVLIRAAYHLLKMPVLKDQSKQQHCCNFAKLQVICLVADPQWFGSIKVEELQAAMDK